jgi:DNA-directed RNA polymerase specialized sigma24 family protein
METQVSASVAATPARLPPEKRAIVLLCSEPLSVAEISAKLRLHLGVTRILVGDLRAAGQLDVHVLDNDFPDPDTIMRVIRGLRALS